MRGNRLGKHVFAAGIALVCLACVPSGAMRPASDRPLSLAELKNATYTGFTVTPEAVTLADGHWEGQPYNRGGAARPSVDFVGDLHRTGRIGSRPSMDATVVFLAESAGGSGSLLYVAVVERKQGRPVNMAMARLGDRVQIRDVRLEDGAIVVDVLQAGDQDAACCPGQLATRRWQYSGGQLTESAPAAHATRFSLDILAGTTWALRAWAFNQPAADDPLITLAYIDGRFAGGAGCNRYFAPVAAGRSPGEITVGTIGSTRMICPETTMDAERRFLNQLQGVKKLAFFAGELALTCEVDGNWTTMRFQRVQPSQ